MHSEETLLSLLLNKGVLAVWLRTWEEDDIEKKEMMMEKKMRKVKVKKQYFEKEEVWMKERKRRMEW